VRRPEDQKELFKTARKIGRQRGSIYVLCDEEKAAIDAAHRSGIASDDDVSAFWKRLE
jgi:hypothetical protein